MFEREWVEVYLQDVEPEVDGEKRVLKLRMYLNPCAYDQAAEVAPEIAEAMFNSRHEPRQVIHAMNFIKAVPDHSMAICRNPEYAGDRMFMSTVKLTKFAAQHVTPGSPAFALMWTASFEIEDKTFTASLVDLMHEKIHVSFKLLQGELPFSDPVMALTCRLCEGENPEWATIDGQFAYCTPHSINKQEEEKLRRIRKPEEARAAFTEQPPADADEDCGEPGENAQEKTDPLLSGEDINKRNSGKRSTRRVN